jgi:hypothetical protein
MMRKPSKMTAFEALREAEAMNIKVSTERGKLRVTGSKTQGATIKALLQRKDEIIAELLIREWGCGSRPPETILGRLARNLVKWRTGEMVQLDDGRKVDAVSMSKQIYAKIASLPGESPDAELESMVRIFKFVTGKHEWGWRSPDYSFPEGENNVCVVSAKDTMPNTGNEKPGKVMQPKRQHSTDDFVPF